MIGTTRRDMLTTGAAATVMVAASRALAQKTSQEGAAMSFYEKGPVRIHFEETGSGLPLLIIPEGGLNSMIAALSSEAPPLAPAATFKSEYRCIAADRRNASGGQLTGPLEVE